MTIQNRCMLSGGREVELKERDKSKESVGRRRIYVKRLGAMRGEIGHLIAFG